MLPPTVSASTTVNVPLCLLLGGRRLLLQTQVMTNSLDSVHLDGFPKILSDDPGLKVLSKKAIESPANRMMRTEFSGKDPKGSCSDFPGRFQSGGLGA